MPTSITMPWNKAEVNRIEKIEEEVKEMKDSFNSELNSIKTLLSKIKNIAIGIAIGVGITGVLIGAFSFKQIIDLFK